MTLLDLLNQDGLEFKPATRDQWRGPCPECGGEDRFCVWPDQGNGGRWWCRGCEKQGDAIQYLREFRGLAYREACQYLGQEPKSRYGSLRERNPKAKRDNWTPKGIASPVALWQEVAQSFLAMTEKALWGRAGKWFLDWLHRRGLRDETIRAARLGWNSSDRPSLHQPSREEWGLPEEIIDGKPGGRLWLPKGFVIPLLQGGQVARLRVRRFEEEGPRYVTIPGSSSCPMVLGKDSQAMVVVESELDGLLLHQEAGDLVGVVVLGSVSIRPDRKAFEILFRAEIILVALDSDDAGAREAWGWWQAHFPRARRWPVPDGKDPGEAWQKGVDLRSWILAGLAGAS